MWKNIKNCKQCGKTFVYLAMLKTLPCDKIKSFVNFKLSFNWGTWEPIR